MAKKTTSSTSNTLPGFKLEEKLGSGSFSSVYKAYDKKNKTVVAIKCIDKTEISKGGADRIIREIKILKMIQHPHIVQMMDFQWDDKYVYIVLEYCNGGDLSKYIKKKQTIPEMICKKFMVQLIEGLKYLRSKGIYHYDLKPPNILLQKGTHLTLKISDFGLSLFADMFRGRTEIVFGPRGSPSYMAPEVLLCSNYDPALIDLWSLGVVLYECLHGKLPLPTKSIRDLMNTVKAKTPIKVDKNLSYECKSLLNLLLSYDPRGRITFEQMLKHPFVDLEYNPPTDETFKKAIHAGQRAVKLDYDKEYHRAFNKYCETLKYLVPFVTREEEIEPSTTSSGKESEETEEIEELKQPMVVEDEKSTESDESIRDKFYFKEASHLTSEQVGLLKKMARPTPRMYDGLDVGYAAQMYLYEGNYQEAMDKFMIALSILVPLIPLEPCGRRKELLKIQVKEWLKQAESIKILLAAHEDVRKASTGHSPRGQESFQADDFCRTH